ncbi:hypothetical protein V8F33_001456 [Rhypophila sp. PSN 637]
MSKKAYSSFRKAKTKERMESMPDNIEDGHIQQVIFAPPAVDMSRLCGEHSDEAIEAAVERLYVNTEIYLQPDGRKLWTPSLEGIDWTDSAEKPRRERAGVFMRHVLGNEEWEKSEYAWDAGAWADVFGKMRDDPLVAADKRRFYFWEGTHQEVSRLMKQDDIKIQYRIPDAVFGLTTFKKEAYQTPPELEHNRLQALMAQPA